MTITAYAFTPLGSATLVEVTSGLSSPTYFWYLDGVFYARTTSPELTLYLGASELAEIVAVDTTSPDSFDVAANAPTAYPARRTLWFVRSLEAGVVLYRVKQQKEAAGYTTVAEILASDAWSYRVVTPRLDNLSNYDWTVFPVDAAGNEGTALAISQTLIVRTPDAPDFTVAFDSGTTRVTFTAA